ncbi:uncharacterized protein LOC135386148 isoform X2 [Ornithodoros turicata]|uniref:uncharacterized protein LOC135374508 n=1 Tax=Ornithodoros turicata TaxID=34597 RepID=UPI003138C5E2
MEFPPKNPTPVSNRYCSVPQCNSKASKDREVAFHNFPGPAETCIRNGQTVNRRNEWVRVLRIGKKVSKAMLVCSKHFRKEDYFFPDLHSQKRRLKKAVVPSENLPVLSTHDAKKEQLKTERKEQREQRLLQRQKRHESCQPMEIMLLQPDSV